MDLTKPTVTLPEGEPSGKSLRTDDLVVGDGATAEPGRKVSVHYVGVSWNSGNEFDASWNRGQLFSFTLGAGSVIPGWEQGVAGMKVGGRRQLVIPPALAYGPSGAGGVIGPNEHLVFVVDLVEVA